MTLQQQLVYSLFALALISLGLAVIGLYSRPRESMRAFWFMCGIWGFIDGVVGWSSVLQDPMPLGELRVVLGVNIGLQAIYLPLGYFMLIRSKPLLQGFGWGILIQAVALGVIDVFFFIRCGVH